MPVQRDLRHMGSGNVAWFIGVQPTSPSSTARREAVFRLVAECPGVVDANPADSLTDLPAWRSGHDEAEKPRAEAPPTQS